MQSKSLLIAIAAFAVTTTGVSAYAGMGVQGKARLTSEQIEAFEEARELRESGDKDKARDILLEAGIDEDTLKNLHKARKAHQEKMHAAVEEGDYGVFRELVSDSPLADILTTEKDFEMFREAHQLKADGEWEEAKEIFTELGMEEGMGEGHHHGHGHMGGSMHENMMEQLTEEQKDALHTAREANDKETVRAILEEAGIEPGMGKGRW